MAEDPAAPVAPFAVGVAPLDDAACFTVTGPDAGTWLQGQMTNDISRLERGDGVYALFVSVRGKVLADAWIHRIGDDALRVTVPASTREGLLTHLDSYVIMEDVEIVPEPVTVLTVQGPEAGAVVEGLDAHRADRCGFGGFDVAVPTEDAAAVLGTLLSRAGRELTQADLDEARFRAGVPRYGADFDETHYPQEAGLKERAVSFTKGCYLGQEVVCTLENRGQLRRRMMLIEGEGLEPGQALEGADGKKLGEVRSTLGHRAFAVLRRAATEGVDEVPVAGGRSVRILRVL